MKTVQAELLKLKYPPILWLVGFVLFSIFVIVVSAYIIDIHNTVSLGINPWIRLNASIRAMFSIFIGVPFIVLFISAALNIEHQNHGFKQLYALPIRRESLILIKLVGLILCLLGVVLLLILGNITIGYVLNFLYPETEFSYFDLPILSMVKSYTYVMISLLGIIGIQFYLSLRFRGFLVPASIGILAYVFGIILSSINNKSSIYFPYCHPTIARKSGVFNTESLNIDQLVILNKVEIYSIIAFVVFLGLSLYSERVRNV